jgi:hypothetical protein
MKGQKFHEKTRLFDHCPYTAGTFKNSIKDAG